MKNDSMEEVSVIIPTYNRIDSLRRTFSYLEKSKLKPLEVLIIDQSNADFSTQIQTLCGVEEDLNVIYIHLEKPSLTAARNVGMKMSKGNVLMYLIPMVVTPILSRLYTPEQFGEWGIFSSTITIIEVVLLGGFEYALIKCKENEVYAVQKLCAFSAMCVLSMCIVAFAVGDFLKISVVQYFGTVA